MYTEDDIYNLYQQLLGRNPLEGGLNYWLQDAQNGATLADLEYNIRNSPEFMGETTADVGYRTQDVYDLYNQYLGRDPGQDGLRYWLDAAYGGTREQLEYNIANSPEYLATQQGNENEGNNQPIGYYWANSGSGWQWYAYYEGEAPPGNAQYVSSGPDMPGSQPPGWTDPNGGDGQGGDGQGGDGQGGGGDAPPPQLYTPDGSMFYRGMFTAQDLLNSNGGAVQSDYYNSARQKILDSLAQQAADNGRTQNTAQEIAVAQGNTPTYSANGLFNPDYASLLANMRF